jgi:hypothetical protein
MKVHYTSFKIKSEWNDGNWIKIYFGWSMITIDIKIDGKVYKDVVSFFFKDTLKLFNKLKKYVEEVKENSKKENKNNKIWGGNKNEHKI